MRFPPPEIVRDETPPDDLLLVVRGGRDSLTDAILQRAMHNSWTVHGFFGISVFGAPGDDLEALSREEPAIRKRRFVALVRCGDLRRRGFEVVPTFRDPRHFSVVLADATADQLDLLRSCFGEAIANPGYFPDR